MKKKNKENIYMNDYSDNIEMFSDTETDSTDYYDEDDADYDEHMVEYNNYHDESNQNTKDYIFYDKKKTRRELKELRRFNERKKRLETYLIMNKLYNQNKKRSDIKRISYN